MISRVAPSSVHSVVVVMLMALIASCTEPDDVPRAPFARLNAANAVSDDDERALGQHIFLRETWGAEQLGEWPPAEFLLALINDEPDVFGEQFTRFGFLEDVNDEFPVGLKRGSVDDSRVYQTCALCHVHELDDGRVWLGAPNLRLDLGAFKVAVNERWVAAGNDSLLSDDDIAQFAQIGPGRFDVGSDSYPLPVPADFPPYFNLAAKTALNYLGTGGNLKAEMTMAIYTFGAGAPNDVGVSIPFPSEKKLDAFARFLGSIAAPKNITSVDEPGIDQQIAFRGRQVFFGARCQLCHHEENIPLNGVVPIVDDESAERVPGDDDAFPRGAIATSAAHRVLIDGDDSAESGSLDTGRLSLITFVLSRGVKVSTTDGYRVPELKGLFATAPYLHNGSVPTLEALLSPSYERPVTFVREGFTVDTSVYGNDNRGHTFGTELTDDDKRALVAYLLSL